MRVYDVYSEVDREVEIRRKNLASLQERYQNYRDHADNGEGGDITRDGQPLLTFQQWLDC